MDLMHNKAFRLITEIKKQHYAAGIYRVICCEPPQNLVVACFISEAPEEQTIKNPSSTSKRKLGRPRKAVTRRPRKKQRPALVGTLVWMRLDVLQRSAKKRQLIGVEIERPRIYDDPIVGERNLADYKLRCDAMENFLKALHLREHILRHEGLGSLVKEAVEKSGLNRSVIYRLWSDLCRLGIEPESLRPRRDRCGAPGVLRPCDPGTETLKARKKAGRKTTDERTARLFGEDLDPLQPGMSTEWRAAILSADKLLFPGTKPAMSARVPAIVASAFVNRYVSEDGELQPLKFGECPNREQIVRVLIESTPWLKKLLEKTTSGHFKRSLRGLVGKAWRGVGGPGHMFAIDSTVGDCYLRSAVNRAWIIGRPIVYVLVDVWSTAIVGFHVCLTGPSWDTAKVSIFNSVASPELMSQLLGFEWSLGLFPQATLPSVLMCDRGEYLSAAAAKLGLDLHVNMSYAAPYRPDLKGTVEVLHRIAKDKNFLFVPGAHDFHRKELELRKSDPGRSVLTVHEFVALLHMTFELYNLTADRTHRMDANMNAAGVIPSPGGLWHYGFEVGIGFQRHIPESTLVKKLLPEMTGQVGRSGIKLLQNHYESDVVNAEQWSTYARNLGSWDIPVWSHPWTVGKGWTLGTESGLIDLKISDQANASREFSFDDVEDAFIHRLRKRPQQQFDALMKAVDFHARRQALINGAQSATVEAESSTSKADLLSISEARRLEVQHGSTSSPAKEASVDHDQDATCDHIEMRKRVREAMIAESA